MSTPVMRHMRGTGTGWTITPSNPNGEDPKTLRAACSCGKCGTPKAAPKTDDLAFLRAPDPYAAPVAFAPPPDPEAKLRAAERQAEDQKARRLTAAIVADLDALDARREAEYRSSVATAAAEKRRQDDADARHLADLEASGLMAPNPWSMPAAAGGAR